MKKISKERKLKTLAVSLRRWKKKLKRKFKTKFSGDKVVVAAPPHLNFSKNFNETVEFLDAFRDATLIKAKRRTFVHIELETIKTITVPVAIVLAAEFHRWSLVKKVRLRVRNSRKWAPDVRNLLSDLGAFDLLGIRRISHEQNGSNYTLTPLKSGDKADGKKIDDLQSQFKNVINGFTSNPEMFAGLSEAAENAIAHAYPPEYEPPHQYAGHRWWGASCLDVENMKLRFFIFDQGSGIPFTLPSVDWYESIRIRLSVFTGGIIGSDSLMLKAALETGRTRTGLTNRGLGLKRMADVVTGAGNGFLRILSGKGEIIYHSDETIVSHDHDRHIGGTLIEWNMNADVFSMSEE